MPPFDLQRAVPRHTKLWPLLAERRNPARKLPNTENQLNFHTTCAEKQMFFRQETSSALALFCLHFYGEVLE